MIVGNQFQSGKTHCPCGHEYTPENTKLARSTKPGRFKRQCRKCKAEVSRRGRLAKLACDSPQKAQRASLVRAAGGGADVAANRRPRARPRSLSASASTVVDPPPPDPIEQVRRALQVLQARRADRETREQARRDRIIKRCRDRHAMRRLREQLGQALDQLDLDRAPPGDGAPPVGEAVTATTPPAPASAAAPLGSVPRVGPRPFEREARRFLAWRRDRQREVERAIYRRRFASAPADAC